MADLPLWGSMQKAQDDAETIEEAIVRLVGDHNDATDAHLGSTRSLQAHKEDTTLDHPAGAVLADKKTMTEISIDHDFSTIAPWTITGTVTNDDWPGVNLYTEYGVENTSRMRLAPQTPAPFLSYEYGMVFQVEAHWDLSGSTLHAWLGFGLVDDTPVEGFGFIVQAGVLKAYIGYGATQNFATLSGVSISAAHIYRAQLMPAEGVCRFFVDGVMEAELDIPGTSPDSDGGPDIGVRLSGTNDGNMWISDLHFARSLVN